MTPCSSRGAVRQTEYPPRIATRSIRPVLPRLSALLLGISTLALAQAPLPRAGASTTVLLDGRVLISGGQDSAGLPVADTELLDAKGRMTISAAGLSAAPRAGAVTVGAWAGGAWSIGGEAGTLPAGAVERFDLVSELWSMPAPAVAARADACWAGLSDGSTVLAGGRGPAGARLDGVVLGSAGEVRSTFTLGGEAIGCRAAVLPNGDVLIIGGQSTLGAPVDSVWILTPGDPAARPGPSLPAPRQGHAVARHLDAGVVVFGGSSGGEPLDDTLVFDPAASAWSAGPGFAVGRVGHEALVLPNGQIMLVGGLTDAGLTPQHAFWPVGSNRALSTPGLIDSAWLLLPGGQVLRFGGRDAAGVQANLTTEFTAVAQPSPRSTALLTARADFASLALPDGRVLALGGQGPSSLIAEIESLDPGTFTWSAVGTLLGPRRSATATLLPSSEVLVVGGENATGPLATVERFDPDTGGNRPAAPLSRARVGHRATALPDGRVLVSGGEPSGVTELYDAQLDTWVDGPTLPFADATHAVVPLPDGTLFFHAFTGVWSLEPATGAFTALAPPPRSLEGATALSLASGDVYLWAGIESGQPSTVTLEYSWRGGTWVLGGTNQRASGRLGLAFNNGQVIALSGRDDAGTPVAQYYGLDAKSFVYSSGPLTVAHAEGSAQWLPDGTAVVFGGYDATGAPTSVSQALLPGLSPLSELRPRVLSSPPVASPGEGVSLRGLGFVPPLGGGARTNDDRAPVVTLRRLEDQALRVLGAAVVGTSELAVTLPGDLPSGHYALTVTVRAAPSVAVPLRVAAPLGAACGQPWFCASGQCSGGRCGEALDAGVSDGGAALPRALGVGCGCGGGGGEATLWLGVLLLLARARRSR